MLIKRGNILGSEILNSFDAVCFTSNGIVKANGELVMGAGVAKAFRNKWPDLPKRFGVLVRLEGNIVNYHEQQIRYDRDVFIVSFPTKNDWRDNSDIGLIKKSANELMQLANRLNWKNVALTKPGCGLGGLKWNEVSKVLEPILDNRVTIFDI